MSDLYTNADVQAAALAACSCQAAPADLHDPEQRIDCAWTRDCVSAALDAVAPAIAARALRDAANWIDDASEDQGGLYAGDCTGMLLDRADEIEGRP